MMSTGLVFSAAALGVTGIICFTMLRAWRGWLDLKRLELARREPAAAQGGDVGLRIELAAVRERLKQLEAIASGVDL
jgi:hypothetical protein